MSSVKNVINDSYKIMLLKDYLREAIKEAGFSEVDIQRVIQIVPLYYED